MSARKQKKTINFFLEDKLEKSPLGKFLKWALNIGRYVITFTELIVIIVFVSRFKLDKDLANIHEEITRLPSPFLSPPELENEVRFLQKRLTAIDKAQKQDLKASLVLKELSKIIPFDVAFSDLEINKNSILLTGTSLSNIGIATFLSGLKSSSEFEQLDLKSISSGEEKNPALEFQISAKLAQE